ncbi:MAG: hypothetical protein ACFCU7_00020 [Pleurocapsa sp.]
MQSNLISPSVVSGFNFSINSLILAIARSTPQVTLASQSFFLYGCQHQLDCAFGCGRQS